LPLIGSYQRQARVQLAERAQTRGQTADQAQAPEPAQSGSQSQTLDDDDDDDQVLASDLTNQGRAALQLDIQYYTQQEKEFREQDSAVRTLKKWVANTVSPHYVEVAYSATETLAQWYANLKDHVGISDIRSQMSAQEQYKDALKPLTKSKDWSKWLSN
jgi:hypothetical protein